MSETRGIVLFGDIVASRRDAGSATSWLRTLTTDLDHAHATDRLAHFAFTQGDEIQGLLRIDADPFRAVLRAALHPMTRPMRWAIAAGPIDPGRGPAIERTGAAFLMAREAILAAATGRDGMRVVTGDARTDALLDDLAPILAERLTALTERQRTVARLLLVDGLRQADAAERLGITRATVSVVAARARVRSIGRLARALATLVREGAARTGGEA